MKIESFLIALLVLLFFGCSKNEQTLPQFELLRKDATGLEFKNTLMESVDFNALNYMYYYNGGGVGAGDFNKDGLVDLYFTSNMGPNKLFLNQGNLQFRDVTEQAQLEGREGWTTGVSVVDINNDGLLDIYVGQLGDYQTMKGQNQLYVCLGIEDGIPVFEDRAIPYGLDLIGFSTQATFFDYDLDGDLDMYQLNYSLHHNGTFGQRRSFAEKDHPMAGDKLMRNDNGKFVNVSREAGIHSTVIGYGLGIATGDVNLDGWPDIYIGNDFHENDYLYINQKDGTFKEVLTSQMMHTSRFSMGVDMADINNDGFSEIISLDMMPYDPFILKSSQGENEFSVFNFKLGFGYAHQYARNNLQLNNGDGSFSEIGLFAGVYATDWSWSSLFMDFDNDGYKDLFVGNGIPRRMNDLDYINYRKGDENFKFRTNNNHMIEENLEVIAKMPRIKLPNKFFRNTKNLKFQDIGGQIKGAVDTYSNGAVYADLDNDGDLDIVVNNIEDEPFIYKNLTVENGGKNQDYLSLRFVGPFGNVNAIGAKAVAFKGIEKIIFEQFPVRGFQSSVELGLHIGIGDSSKVDSILVIWPDRSFQRLADLSFNKKNEVVWQRGLPLLDFDVFKQNTIQIADFKDVTNKTSIDFKHSENPFIEFHREGLIPHMVSKEGPALAVGDVNGDGLEDVFFGGAKNRKSALYLQKPDGTFYQDTPHAILQDSLFEDVDAVFVDIENDGDLDLVIAAGGNEFWGEQEAMKQRGFLNDGQGNFERMVFPDMFMTASCVLPADFNNDGLVDFFFGARALPWNFGITPNSVLLQNNGKGGFENVTEKIGGGMNEVGLVKNGVWADIDGDGDSDLLLAVEWEPITMFLNDDGHFEKTTVNNLSGWWNFVLPHDFDGDGDMDILAGNLGGNSRLKPTPAEPVRLYVNDFDDNDQVEPILTYYLDGREIPFANYSELTKQLVHLKKKYLYARDFAAASMEDLFGKEKLGNAVVREANTFHSMYFENTGNMKFKSHPLPDRLQFSTLNAAQLADVNNDGKMEILLGGNFYDSNIAMGRYDAGGGHVLSISKNGQMEVYPLGDVKVKEQVRRIEPVKIGDDIYFIFGKNDADTQVILPIFQKGEN